MRGVSPVVGVVVLVFVVITLSVTVGVAVNTTAPDPPPTVEFSVSADATADSIVVTHRAGSAVDVNEVNVTVEIDGDSLAYQPPVPFFAATGFESGPTGPFNTASDDVFRAGESAGIRLADTNEPQLRPGVTVTVTIRTDRAIVGRDTVTATG